MVSNNWVIENLEAELAKFDDEPYDLPKHHIEAVEGCIALLSGKSASSRHLSKARRNAREHARTILADIYSGVGAEAFILSCMSMSISKLAKIPHQSLVPDIRRWWNSLSPPQGLTMSAKILCEFYSVDELTLSIRGAHTVAPTRPSGYAIDMCISTAEPAERDESHEIDNTIGRPHHQPAESVFTLTSHELFEFLVRLGGPGEKLQMECPWTGSPPPWIVLNLESAGLSGRLELSAPLSAALMKDIQASRAPAQIPHGGFTV